MEFTNLGKILLQRQWQINQHNKAEVKQGIQTNFDVIVTMKGFNKCMEFFANQIELSFLNRFCNTSLSLILNGYRGGRSSSQIERPAACNKGGASDEEEGCTWIQGS